MSSDRKGRLKVFAMSRPQREIDGVCDVHGPQREVDVCDVQGPQREIDMACDVHGPQCLERERPERQKDRKMGRKTERRAERQKDTKAPNKRQKQNQKKAPTEAFS